MDKSDLPPDYNSLYPIQPDPLPSAPIEEKPTPTRIPSPLLPPTCTIPDSFSYSSKAVVPFQPGPPPSAPFESRPGSPQILPRVLPPTCTIACSSKASTLTCPSCHTIVKTTTETRPTTKSHVAAVIVFTDRPIPHQISPRVLPSTRAIAFGPKTTTLTYPPSARIQKVVSPSVQPPTHAIDFGPEPTTLTCPFCHNSVKTRTKTQPTTKCHVTACILFVIGCYFCFCLPYCLSCCRNTLHYCPDCKAYLGKYKRNKPREKPVNN